MAGVSKIQLFGLCYSCLKQKADPNIAGMKSVNDSLHFKRTDTDETFNTLKGPLDCSCNHVIHLFEYKQCHYRFPYVGRAKIKFSYRINNYKSTHRSFRKKRVEKDLAIVIKKSELKQNLFHEHYCSEGYQDIENWSVTLIY